MIEVWEKKERKINNGAYEGKQIAKVNHYKFN